MKQFRRKPHSGRSRSASNYEHWLGEGIQGQETLVDDLDPTLYLADSAICSLITSTALACGSRDRRPQAILVPNEGEIGWHIGYLAKRFDVAVWTGDDDELISETAYRFNAKTFSGDLAEQSADGVELILFSAYNWPSVAEFVRGVDEALDCLSENGAAAFVLPLEISPNGALIRWSAEASTPLARLTEPDEAIQALPRSSEVLEFSAFDPRETEVLNSFLKRHREYFGKNIRELVVDRLTSPEFALQTTPFGAALLVYSVEE